MLPWQSYHEHNCYPHGYHTIFVNLAIAPKTFTLRIWFHFFVFPTYTQRCPACATWSSLPHNSFRSTKSFFALFNDILNIVDKIHCPQDPCFQSMLLFIFQFRLMTFTQVNCLLFFNFSFLCLENGKINTLQYLIGQLSNVSQKIALEFLVHHAMQLCLMLVQHFCLNK